MKDWDTEGPYIKGMLDCGIPEHMRHGLLAYIVDRTPPGGFLIAVLSNDLADAVAKADIINQHALPAYVRFLYNHAPRNCWGSPEIVKSWLNDKDT